VNNPYARNDRTATEVKESGAFSTSYEYTDPVLDMTGYTDVDFAVLVTDKGANSVFTFKAQTSQVAVPGNDDWADVLWDNGTETLTTYARAVDKTGVAVPFPIWLNFPRRGLHMRLAIKADVSATGSYSVTALKNVR
jgi:hypothetical protein